MDIGKWLKIAAQFAPQILLLTPLAPIAGAVSAGIQEAEQIEGATGREKLRHVANVALAAADAVNDKAGRVVIDPSVVKATADSAISTAVNAVNLVHGVTESHASENTPS